MVYLPASGMVQFLVRVLPLERSPGSCNLNGIPCCGVDIPNLTPVEHGKGKGQCIVLLGLHFWTTAVKVIPILVGVPADTLRNSLQNQLDLVF